MWIERRLPPRRAPRFALALVLTCAIASVAGSPATPPPPSTPATAVRTPDGARDDALARALVRAFAHGAPATVAAADVAALEFVRSADVTRREQDAALRHFRRAGARPSGDVERRIRSGAMLRDFDRLLAANGHSPTNLGDVLAAYMVLSWEVVNDRDATRMPQGMRAVRRQLIGALAGVPSIAAMDAAARQAQAERTAYLALAAVAAHRALKSSGDTTQLASLRASVRQSMLRSGIDLEALELTQDGFRPR